MKRNLWKIGSDFFHGSSSTGFGRLSRLQPAPRTSFPFCTDRCLYCDVLCSVTSCTWHARDIIHVTCTWRHARDMHVREWIESVEGRVPNQLLWRLARKARRKDIGQKRLCQRSQFKFFAIIIVYLSRYRRNNPWFYFSTTIYQCCTV